MSVGRREQHKARTRQAIQDAALRMFEEYGFEGTTVRDIAAAVGVTERTFFRYFPSKEDLVLNEVMELLPLLRAHLVERPAEEPPFTAVRNALTALADARVTALGILFSDTPARFFTNPRPARPVLFEFENGVAEALHQRTAQQAHRTPEHGTAQSEPEAAETSPRAAAADTDTGNSPTTDGTTAGDTAAGEAAPHDAVTDVRSSVLARAAVAALRSALLAQSALPGEERTPENILRLLHEAFDALDDGCSTRT